MSKKIKIFDTTLRDGEQCPGASMNLREKMEVARQLCELNVDVIEAGFPIASPGDFKAVQEIAEQIRGPVICGLARCLDKDIEKAAQALEQAEKNRIHVFLATSKIHMKYKLKKTEEETLEFAVKGVQKAKKFSDDIEFSPEDASRSDPEFLVRVLEAVIDAGATTVNIPDTVGYAVPDEFGQLIAFLNKNVSNISQAIISVHCHNDLGLAVANSLSAVQNGARQVECTINGIGERAGNAAMEEIVMALQTRKDFYSQFEHQIKTTEIYKASRLVSNLTGFTVQPNKAIVGDNAFAHEAGIHQDGVLKEKLTYEIMTPESVGLGENKLVLGKHSGHHAFEQRLKELGFKLSKEEVDQAFQKFKVLADKKKTIYEEDLFSLIEEQLTDMPNVYVLEQLSIHSETGTEPNATVRLSSSGEDFEDVACGGDGPLDAACRAIDKITGTKGVLKDYSSRSVTSGKDAMAETVVKVEVDGKLIIGKGSSTDIIEAGTKAYLNAINRVALMKEKSSLKGI